MLHNWDNCKECKYVYASNAANVKEIRLYIFLRNSCDLNIRENVYTAKITFIIAYRASYT